MNFFNLLIHGGTLVVFILYFSYLYQNIAQQKIIISKIKFINLNPRSKNGQLLARMIVSA